MSEISLFILVRDFSAFPLRVPPGNFSLDGPVLYFWTILMTQICLKGKFTPTECQDGFCPCWDKLVNFVPMGFCLHCPLAYCSDIFVFMCLLGLGAVSSWGVGEAALCHVRSQGLRRSSTALGICLMT